MSSLISPEDKFDEAIETAMRDRRNLIEYLGGFNDTEAGWEPENGEWSIAHGAEHILLTDKFARTNMLKTLEEAERTGVWENAPEVPKKITSEQLRRGEQGPVPAPDNLLPVEGKPLSEMIPLLFPSREETAAALQPYRSRELERLLPPPTRYGELNVYDRMTYMGIHDALHQEQMERVTREPGFGG